VPIYIWVDKNTETQVEIIRNLSAADEVPDIIESGMGIEEYDAADWEKRMSSTTFKRGPGWRGSKGNW